MSVTWPGGGMTVSDAARAMVPPIPPRELARRLRYVAPIGTQHRRRGRPARIYPIAAIMRAHAEWVRAHVGK